MTVLGKDLTGCKAAVLSGCRGTVPTAVPAKSHSCSSNLPIPTKKGFSLPTPAQHHPRGMPGERCEPQQPPGCGVKSEPRFAAHHSPGQRRTIPGLSTSHLLLVLEGTTIKLYVIKYHKLHPVTSSHSMVLWSPVRVQHQGPGQ